MDSTRLQSNLREILDSTQKMLAVLDEERGALAAGDVEALDKAGSRKLLLADTLEQLDQVRTDLICRHRAEHQRPHTMAAMLEACDATGELTSLWDAVQSNVSDCDKLNQINGSALRVRRESVSRALKLLHGSADNTPVYDNSGRTDAAISSGSGTSLGRV